jgi:hypothetical protein
MQMTALSNGHTTGWAADGAQLAVCEFHHSHRDIVRQPLPGNSSIRNTIGTGVFRKFRQRLLSVESRREREM